jgi:hypothetical protein
MRDCRNVLRASRGCAEKAKTELRRRRQTSPRQFPGSERRANAGGNHGACTKSKGPRPSLFFHQTMSGSDAITNSYPTYDPPRTVVGFVLFGKGKHELLCSTW